MSQHQPHKKQPAKKSASAKHEPIIAKHEQKSAPRHDEEPRVEYEEQDEQKFYHDREPEKEAVEVEVEAEEPETAPDPPLSPNDILRKTVTT